MLISFACTKCGSELETALEDAGKQVKCPECGTVLTVPRKGIEPGTTIAGFEIQKLLGKGGMGEVYLARQLSLDRSVALKILPSAMGMQKPLVDRFLHEVKLLASLDHSNIVTAYEAGEDSGILYLAMAYVKGESLAERLDRAGPLAEKDALAIVRKLAAALSYAWKDHHLLHRDIKPGNILLDAAGEPKLADLGLSKSLDDASVLSLSGSVMGTPNYMSPEQASGEREIDFRADMYSLGATLYHMLTGKVPFAGSSLMDTLRKQVTEPLPDPRESNPAVSEACVALMEIMLAKNPQDRYESWEGLIEDLDWVLAGNQPSKAAPTESVLMRVQGHRVKGKAPSAKAPGKGAKSKAVPLAVASLAAVALGLASVFWFVAHKPKAPAAPTEQKADNAKVDRAVSGAVAPAEEDRAGKLKESYTEALQYALAHPEDCDGAVKRFEELKNAAAGTEFEAKASAEIARLQGVKQKAVEQAVAALKAKVQQLIADGKLDEAQQQMEGIQSPYADEMKVGTADLMGEVKGRLAERARQQQDQQRQVQAAETTPKAGAERIETEAGSKKAATPSSSSQGLAKVLADVASRVLRQEFADAQQVLKASATAETDGLTKSVEAVSRMPDVILTSFRKDVGKTVSVGLRGGAEEFQIKSVSGTTITAQQTIGAASVERSFTLGDLTIEEKVRRLGMEKRPDLEIMRGLLAYQAQRPAVARQFFEKAGVGLGKDLLACMDRAAASGKEEAAGKAFAELLKLAGLTDASGANQDVVKSIRKRGYTPPEIKGITNAVARFRKDYGATEKASGASAALVALERVSAKPQVVDQSTVEKAIGELKRVNGIKGELSVSFEATDDGVDLNLSGNSNLVSIAPLAGLPVRKLDLSNCGVESIKALKGMPLKELRLWRCKAIHDISALSGAPIEVLDLGLNAIDDISPLRGMPLRVLILNGNPFADLAPLKGMPLEFLQIKDCRSISQLDALRGLPLKTLDMYGSRGIRDLRPLLWALVNHGCSLLSIFFSFYCE